MNKEEFQLRLIFTIEHLRIKNQKMILYTSKKS